jgi:hypothetical protein
VESGPTELGGSEIAADPIDSPRPKYSLARLTPSNRPASIGAAGHPPVSSPLFIALDAGLVPGIAGAAGVGQMSRDR